MADKRIEWIDIAKGIGILLVVLGHIFSNPILKYSRWFYMPLFFFISGYLYRPTESIMSFVKKRASHLLLPYLSYMILLGIITYISYIFLTEDPNITIIYFLEFIWRLIYGGCALGGVFGYLGRSFGIFWFIACLFLTQIIYHLIRKITFEKDIFVFFVILAMYIIAMLDSNYQFMAKAFWQWGLPWNLNVVALAIVFFWCGHLIKEFSQTKTYENSAHIYDTIILTISFVYITVAIILDNTGVISPGMGQMKFARYGIPVYSILLTFSCICLTIRFSKFLSIGQDIVKSILKECGKASMVIMFVHYYIQYTMNDYPSTHNPFLRTIVSVLFCYCLYKLFMLSAFTKKIFLGIFSSKPKLR